MDPVTIALVTAGMGVLWWRHLRHAAPPALAEVVDGDAEVVLHVASHEARTRGEPLCSLHVFYGLLQDETIAAAVRDAGGDVTALEDATLAALEARRGARPVDDDDAQRVLMYAHGHAHHAARRVTVVDLWAYLRGSDAAAVIDAGPASVRAVLHRLCHRAGDLAPPVAGPDVHVVLRNDEYTTQAFVCEVLVDVFGLARDDATARMLATHTDGRAIVGRYPLAVARAKLDEARARATRHGFPLWIATEPT